MINLIETIASDQILEQAYLWLCNARKKLSHNNDIWNLRTDWQKVKPGLKQALLRGNYELSPQSEIRLPDGMLECWTAQDSLVLKAVTIVLSEHLSSTVLSNCVHIAGNGGAKHAVRQVYKHLSATSHVMRSDAKSYYASIDHCLLFNMLSDCIPDRYVLRLLWQYLKRTVCYGENYREVNRGISLGCPLSPLMAALYLRPLDKIMHATGLFYIRFMDDWVVIAPNRWKLRKAVKQVNEVLATLKLEQHPDKTYIGRAEKGFDFLGYHFEPGRVRVASETVARFIERALRLYEREPGEPCGSSRFGEYVNRWMGWARLEIT